MTTPLPSAGAWLSEPSSCLSQSSPPLSMSDAKSLIEAGDVDRPAVGDQAAGDRAIGLAILPLPSTVLRD